VDGLNATHTALKAHTNDIAEMAETSDSFNIYKKHSSCQDPFLNGFFSRSLALTHSLTTSFGLEIIIFCCCWLAGWTSSFSIQFKSN